MSQLTRRHTPMKPLAKILIAGTATLMLTLNSAYADGSNNSGGESNILNGQVDFNTQQATLNLGASQIQGSVTGASTAGGNAIDITTMNNTNVTNSQYVGGWGGGAD